jgi:hypothetical protein
VTLATCIECRGCPHGSIVEFCTSCSSQRVSVLESKAFYRKFAEVRPTCQHGSRLDSSCRSCGRGFCPHWNRKGDCELCGKIGRVARDSCKHNRYKWRCRLCSPRLFCSHDRSQNSCMDCPCPHHIPRRECVKCKRRPELRCSHEKRKSACRLCKPEKFPSRARKLLAGRHGDDKLCPHGQSSLTCQDCCSVPPAAISTT